MLKRHLIPMVDPMNETETLQKMIDGLADRGNQPALVKFEKEGDRDFTYSRLASAAGKVASGLIRMGVKRGDPVGLMGRAGFEWTAVCLGTIRAGAAVMPLDLQHGRETLSRIIRDSGAQIFFADEDRFDVLKQAGAERGGSIFLLDAPATDDWSWERVLREGPDGFPDLQPDSRATLFYTSGTTGPPKGVPLSHRNISFQLEAVRRARLVNESDRFLLPLPLHHVYPLVIGLFVPISLGLTVVLPFSRTGPQLVRALKEGSVTVIIGVPRLYSALYSGIAGRFESSGSISSGLFKGAVGLSARLRRGTGIAVGKRLLSPIHNRLGRQLRVLASGGSSLGPDLAWKLVAMGWEVAVGYGLTETSPLLTLLPPGDLNLDTVGRVLPGVELRIDHSALRDGSEKAPRRDRSQGEILARGPGVFSGYLNLDERTEEALTGDGWFRTGDLGFLDGRGYLHVTGRVSTRIVTEGGENIQPDEVEEIYGRHPFIREAGLLQKEGRLVLLVVPEMRELRKARETDVEESVRRAVSEQSRLLASYKRVSDVATTRKPLERTRLGKIRRHLLPARFEEAKREKHRPDAAPTGPIPIEEMQEEDRRILEAPEAKKVWDWLSRRFADRELTPDTSPEIDLGVDSLEWIDLTMEIRQRAGVELNEEQIAAIETVRDLLAAVGESPSAGASGGGLSFDDPEALLTPEQKRWLAPLSGSERLQARVLTALNGALIRTTLRPRVMGGENIPRNGQFVFAPNHVSYLDPFVLASTLGSRRLRRIFWAGFVGAAFANPLNRYVSRLAKAVPVDEKGGALSSLAFGAAVLKRGDSLVWFPEGRRSPDGRLRPFKEGIGILLENRPVPAVPIFILGTEKVLPVGRAFPRFGRVTTVIFGRPYEVEELDRLGSGEEKRERIANALHDLVEDLERENRESKS